MLKKKKQKRSAVEAGHVDEDNNIDNDYSIKPEKETPKIDTSK